MGIFSVVEWATSSAWRGRKNRQHANDVERLRARGVTAPAVVVQAIVEGSRSNVDGHFTKIRYTVDVHPAGSAPFRTSFEHWSERRGYTAVAGEIQEMAGTHVWVTYDPADPSEMIYECTEAERAANQAEADLDARRLAFNAIAQPLEELRERGTPATAVVVGFEDLHLPYPRRQSGAIRLHVDVATPNGGSYGAVIPALIATAAYGRYATGRRVFVRVDAHRPDRVVLDSVRNRDLPL
jgi:hypothetical protein